MSFSFFFAKLKILEKKKIKMALVMRNRRRRFWSDEEINVLIAVRARTNERYWYSAYGNYCEIIYTFKIKKNDINHINEKKIFKGQRGEYWNMVAGHVNTVTGSRYTGVQCRSKFERLVESYEVSKY
jgi:hypothetical protein